MAKSLFGGASSILPRLGLGARARAGSSIFEGNATRPSGESILLLLFFGRNPWKGNGATLESEREGESACFFSLAEAAGEEGLGWGPLEPAAPVHGGSKFLIPILILTVLSRPVRLSALVLCRLEAASSGSKAPTVKGRGSTKARHISSRKKKKSAEERKREEGWSIGRSVLGTLVGLSAAARAGRGDL